MFYLLASSFLFGGKVIFLKAFVCFVLLLAIFMGVFIHAWIFLPCLAVCYVELTKYSVLSFETILYSA